jgi:hypothetical protein
MRTTMGTRRTFVVGHRYTRDQIGEAPGRSRVAYLPTVGGRVVAGAFNPALNRDAPDVVLPGVGPVIEESARAFAAQGVAVPVFLKRATNHWEYRGDYRVRALSTDPAAIRSHAARSGRTPRDVTMVLFLEPPPPRV